MPRLQPGLMLDDWQVETIKRVYILTGNQSEAARQAGCSGASANKYVRMYQEELLELRKQKQPELVEILRALLQRILSEAFDPAKLSEATFRDLMVGTGILVEKIQLLTGGATERVQEIPPNIEVMLTPEEKHAMASIRRKLEEAATRRDSDDDRQSPWMRDVIDVESKPVQAERPPASNGHRPQRQEPQPQEPLDPALPPQLRASINELREDKAVLERKVREGTATHAQRLRLPEVERLLKRKEEGRRKWLEDWRKRQEEKS